MRHLIPTVICGWLLAASNLLSAAEPIRLVSDPCLSPDGQQVAFGWRGDVWIASINGGPATRITTDPADDGQPLFSPDGQSLAFVSRRTGSQQIYVVPASGGQPRQVTFHSEGYTLHDWFPDGKHLLASGSRDHFWRGTERLLKVTVEERKADIVLANATATDASLDREGKRVLFTREGERWWRKGYQGERAAQVWMLDLESGQFTEILHEGVDCRWPVWNRNGKAFFFTKGDATGFDLYRYRFPEEEGAEAKQVRLAGFDDDSVVFPTIARDSGLIVFRHLFDLYRFQPGKDEQPTKIELTYEGDPNVDEDELRRSLERADDVAFSNDGLEIIVAAGGDLWGLDTELKEPVRITQSASHERTPLLSADGQAIFTVAKQNGQVDIWKIEKLHDKKYWWQPNEYKWTKVTDDSNVESNLKLAPNGKHLYYVRDRGDLYRRSLDDDANVIQLASGFSPPDYDISPCSQWIAYSSYNDDFNSEVWIRKADGSSDPHNVSQHPDDDENPRFSPDGKLLAFTGRQADTETDIYYVYLQDEESERTARDRKLQEAIEKMTKNRKEPPTKKAENPNSDEGQESGEEAAGSKAEDSDSEKHRDESDGEAQDNQPEVDATRIDFEGISQRVRRISIEQSTESGLFWHPESKKLAFNANVNGQRGTYTVEFPDELKPKLLTTDRISGPQWSRVAKGILGLVDGVPALIDDSGKATRYAFRAQQEMSRGERYRDGFEEAWVIMRDRWYDSRLANRNWDEVRRKFSDMALAAGDDATFAEIVHLLLGELNGSHNGFTPDRNERDQNDGWRDETAHLGVRFDNNYAGPGLRVQDVIPDSPADRVTSRLTAGDIIKRIDGTPVDPALDLTSVLNGPLERDVKLDVLREENGQATELMVVMRPISYGQARGLLYESWLENNRRLVDEQSQGRFGYLHIRAMNISSFQEFERQLYRVGYGKDGLVIDVRDNGGGSTADLLLTALTQPQHAITVPRGGGAGYPQSRMVYAAWQKPIVVLCNQNSYSNAEIFSHAIKTLGRGKLVGVQTAGGVISTGAVRITDLGTMRMPFRAWFVVGTGQDMELNGALPDHVLWPLPGELPSGKDRQLDKAVDVLRQELNDHPTELPRLKYASEGE